MRADFLLEIGCENLPSVYLEGALKQVERLFGEGLESERISLDSLAVLGTPKRLVVHIRGISDKQEASEERIIGPPAAVAVSPEGRFTKAAVGFAKSQGVSLRRLSRLRTEKGEYLAVVKRIRGKSTVSIIEEKVPLWLGGVRFPKVMRWDGSGFTFARPIRWITGILGGKKLEIRVGQLVSGKTTRLSPYFESSIEIEDIDHYFSVIEENRIILDPVKRRKAVDGMARRAAGAVGGVLVEDDELVAAVANLLESPVVLTGTFDDSFLKLPREVVITALKSHQRYFSVEGKQGRLMPKFIAFADGVRKNRREILKGYERVLQARLADAEFYFKEDTSVPLEKMAGKLGGIVWLEGLGNLAQKAKRIEKLALWLQSEWGIGGEELAGDISKAALLAKADLASEMVKDGKEFTLLQGYIGREYARISGETNEVAEAIFEHYLPRFSGDRIPRTDIGVLLSVADKMDTVSGCFLLGLEPSGSQDPYALRRQALGFLRISVEKRVRVALPAAIDRSLHYFQEEGLVPSSRMNLQELSLGIGDFFSQRFNMMLRSEGFDYDIVSAILSAPWEVPFTARSMADELRDLRDKGRLSGFVLAMKRITNIIPRDLKEEIKREMVIHSLEHLEAFAGRNESELGFSGSLFIEEAEGELYRAVSKVCLQLLELENTGETHRCFDVLAELVPFIDRYFEEVLVNCEDERIRNNRISFLASAYRSFGLYCDFSVLVGD